MKVFFKIFFACLLALVIFSLLGFFILMGIGASSFSKDKPKVGGKGILVIDLSNAMQEQSNPDDDMSSAFNKLKGSDDYSVGLYDAVRLIEYAKGDSAIKGIIIKANNNANSYAASEEIKSAIANFKRSNKFVYAYGTAIAQRAYYVATSADKIYVHPSGGVEWAGLSTNLMFYKGLLDKLEIQPEIFYAGKFKSATEPFRAKQMTDANRLQTTVWMGDIYGKILSDVSADRKIDTATLRNLANTAVIRTSSDALKYHLVDGLKYDDEIRTEIGKKVNESDITKLNFVSLATYAKASDFKDYSGEDKIALIYAEGDIVDGQGEDKSIGGDNFRNIIRAARLDNSVKAIVLRVNSPGGSALASDVIWREVALTKKIKPVVVSMGTYAASGGYYISCNGSYIFAEPNTITGSIGVFSMFINPSTFLKNKLGVTFDGVKTGPFADLGSMGRPLTQPERNLFQANVDSIYHTFLSRVAEGRNKTIAEVDSIAQGRVWTGKRAISIGLVDSTGTLKDAVLYAAKLAKSKSFYLKEYPQTKGFFDKLFGDDKNGDMQESMIKNALGDWQFDVYKQFKNLQTISNSVQTRIPFAADLK